MIRELDSDVRVMDRLYTATNFRHGYGETGRRIELVEATCPACGYDRMLRHTRVKPEQRDDVKYYCNKPSCREYHSDRFSYVGF